MAFGEFLEHAISLRVLLVGIALANKIARQIWATVTKNEDYRDPSQAAAA